MKWHPIELVKHEKREFFVTVIPFNNEKNTCAADDKLYTVQFYTMHTLDSSKLAYRYAAFYYYE